MAAGWGGRHQEAVPTEGFSVSYRHLIPYGDFLRGLSEYNAPGELAWNKPLRTPDQVVRLMRFRMRQVLEILGDPPPAGGRDVERATSAHEGGSRHSSLEASGLTGWASAVSGVHHNWRRLGRIHQFGSPKRRQHFRH